MHVKVPTRHGVLLGDSIGAQSPLSESEKNAQCCTKFMYTAWPSEFTANPTDSYVSGLNGKRKTSLQL